MKLLHLEVLGHSLGINVYGAKKSKAKKDKLLPEAFNRNRFCAGETHDDWGTLLELEKMGYMERGATINQGRETLWCVTQEGQKRFRELFEGYV